MMIMYSSHKGSYKVRSLFLLHFSLGSVERIDSVLQGYYNDPMFNVAASYRDGSMAEFEEKREKKRQEILMKCRELDEVRE